MATRKSPDDGRRRANIHVCCVCVCPGHVCACVCVVCVMCCLVVLACLVGLSCWLVVLACALLSCRVGLSLALFWLASHVGARAKGQIAQWPPTAPRPPTSAFACLTVPPPRVRLFTHRKPSSADHLPAALTTRCRYDPHACGGRDTGPSLLPTTGRESQS